MVATPTGTAPQAQPARVASNPARHGRHAAQARARRAIPADQLRELRNLAGTDPRALRGRVPRWHAPDGEPCPGFVRAKTGQVEPCPLHAITSGQYAEVGKAFTWQYDPKTGRREHVREGTTSRVTWLDRDQYLNRFLPAFLALAASRDVLRAHKVDLDTFRQWVRTETLPGYCEQRTGRRVIVRPQTVADVLGVSVSTVHRCRSAARELGIYATVYPGAMLGEEEQRHARWVHKSPQRGMAAESAFVIPREHAGLGSVTCLHRGVPTGHFPADRSSLVTLNTDGEKEATTSPLTKKRRRRASPGYQLARAVVERLPFARNADPSRLAGLLHRFATSSTPWTAQDVVQHVDAVNTRRGWSSITSPLELKAPAHGLLASYLRDTDPNADHPRLDVFLADQRRADQLADRRRIDQEIRDGIRCCRHC